MAAKAFLPLKNRALAARCARIYSRALRFAYRLHASCRPSSRPFGELDVHATSSEVSPLIEGAGDANERARVDELDPAKIHSNDRRSDRNLRDERLSARRSEVGE
jgi:hypothetical protein